MLAIGDVARRTGIKIPTIRYYEQEGLLPAPPRTASGRRRYGEDDVRRLTFIRHARVLGFDLADVRSLLDLADNPARPCADADRIAEGHLKSIRARLAQLRKLEREMKRMIASCRGGGSAGDCAIIESLSDHGHCKSEHAL